MIILETREDIVQEIMVKYINQTFRVEHDDRRVLARVFS